MFERKLLSFVQDLNGANILTVCRGVTMVSESIPKYGILCSSCFERQAVLYGRNSRVRWHFALCLHIVSDEESYRSLQMVHIQ
jgi:hypothetical protein